MSDEAVEPIPRLVDHPQRAVPGAGRIAREFDQPGQHRLEFQAAADRYARIDQELEPRCIGDASVHRAMLDGYGRTSENPRRVSVATPIRRC